MNEKVHYNFTSASQWAGLFRPALVDVFAQGYTSEKLRNDIYGGLTAAVVALPLALAFGVASGAGPIAGLYGAIAVGLFASLFGGTPAQVSGPTGPMTVVMGAVIATHAGNLAEAFTIVMLGGLIQIGFGLLRLGKYIVYTPYSVVSGFMTGIGVIIMIIQTLPFMGLPTAPGGVIGTVGALTSLDIGAIDWRAFALALGSLMLLVFWPARWQSVFPAPLAALIVGTLLSTFVITGLPEIGAVPTGLPPIHLPDFSLTTLPQLFQAAFVLALLGSIDSLLTSLVADSVTRTKHDSDKELVGQGIGNLAAGLLGALPGAGATMRTIVNVRAGGRTPISGALHAIVLLALALGLGPVVAHVPHAVLAAILMKVGWDIIDWGYLMRMRGAPRQKFFIMLITFVLTVFVDLVTAVATGIILASFVTSHWLAEEQLKGVINTAGSDDVDDLSEAEKSILKDVDGKLLLSILKGTFSYASARELTRRTSPEKTGHTAVIYDFSNTGYVDTSAALAIEEMFTLAEANGQAVFVSGLHGAAQRTLQGLKVLRQVPSDRQFANRLEAIKAAKEFIAAEEA